MCDIEKDRKYAVSRKFLETLAETLLLTEAETELMYDLVAFAQKSISADLPEYIMNQNEDFYEFLQEAPCIFR